MYRLTQKIFGLLLFAAFGATVFAQQPPMQAPTQQKTPPVSDKELKNFIAVSQDIQTLNQSLQQNMAKTIQAEGMEVETFQQIQQKMQGSGNAKEAEGVSEEQAAQFTTIMQKLQKMQMQAQQQMMQGMEAAGLSIERYRAIGSAIESDQELQQRAQGIQAEMSATDK
jgi:hypothetical protein